MSSARVYSLKSKRKFTLYLDTKTAKRIDTESEELKLSRQQIMESAVKDRYSPETKEEFAAQVIRRFNRLDNRVKVVERDLLVIAEMHRLFIRMWLSTSVEVPASQKELLQAEGQKRYERFIESLMKRVNSGLSILAELPRESQLTENSFENG